MENVTFTFLIHCNATIGLPEGKDIHRIQEMSEMSEMS